jgi:hypothetical protein
MLAYMNYKLKVQEIKFEIETGFPVVRDKQGEQNVV